ncbi:MAG: hypothetical protein OXU61_01355 [Gammaproteobacteria bacterium]|nr:hypothetical protein [Gammaproteobacteria bacterium]
MAPLYHVACVLFLDLYGGFATPGAAVPAPRLQQPCCAICIPGWRGPCWSSSASPPSSLR